MSNADWYARRLGRPQPPQQPMPALPQQQAYQQQQQPQHPEEYAPRGASHLRAQGEGTCPECASNNYMAPQGTQGRARCYDCGYPVVQSGSGPSSVGAKDLPTFQAAQVNPGGNWNPGGFAEGEGIIGRVG